MNRHWEYHDELIEPSRLEERKNQLGKEGWEAYKQERVNESTDSSYRVSFKRMVTGPQLLKS